MPDAGDRSVMPKGGRALPPGMQYNAHCGVRARCRYLRQRLCRVQKIVNRDPEARKAFLRLMHFTEHVPAEFGVRFGTWQNLALTALQAADETRSTWTESITFMLHKFEAMAKEEQHCGEDGEGDRSVGGRVG